MILATGTPLGRQETCETSLPGWPEDPAMTWPWRNDVEDSPLTIERTPQ